MERDGEESPGSEKLNKAINYVSILNYVYKNLTIYKHTYHEKFILMHSF